MAFDLTPQQRAAVENTGGPLLVSAAAGAGKTRVLVERLLDRVSAGADIDRFLIITFTKAAAAELRSRVSEELAQRLALRPGDRHLRRQTTLVYQAQISTIHSFCGDFLRRWGHLADIDPDFRLLDEGEASELQEEAIADTLEQFYAAPTADFVLLMDTFAAGRDDLGLTTIVLDVYRKLQSHPEPEEWLAAQKRAYEVGGYTDAAQTPWGAYLLRGYKSLAAYWLGQLEPLMEDCEAAVPMYGESLRATLAGLSALAGASAWEEASPPEFPRLKPVKKDTDKIFAERIKELRERCKNQFAKVAKRLTRPSGELLRDLADVAPAAQALLDLVGKFSQEYQKLKTRRGVLDFNDLEHLTLGVLRANPGLASEVAEGFLEVMVDEYQDTNQVQNAIFDCLTAQKGNLFMVGDVKQSIYRFRLADPTIFLEKYRTFPDADRARPGQGRRVVLGQNFRSRHEVLECVNFLFEALMSRELGELDYGPAERLYPGREDASRTDCAPELHVISNPKADEEGDSSMTEPRYVARRLRQLLDSGFPVEDGQGGLRPCEPSDMVILLRAVNPVLGRYARALGEVGIPWASEGGEDFFDTPEAAVALSYLEIIDNPRQDVPLIAVLRSPLYGFPPDRLAELSRERGNGCFYDALAQDESPDSRRVMDDLTALRLIAPDRRSYEVVWELFCRTGMLALYAAMPEGETRRAHLLGLYNYARGFESSGHKGLFSFLTHLKRRRELGQQLKTPAGPSAGVGILSIHHSKGLEYPIVVVAGLGKQFNTQDSRAPMLFHRDLGLGPQGLDQARRIRYPTLARWAVAAKLDEEMLSEELRLLYVALTRAREKLILTAAMKAPERELARLMEQATLPAAPQALASQPTLAHWVLTAALCRKEAEALRMGQVLPHVPPAEVDWGGEWEITLEDGLAFQQPSRAERRVERTETRRTVVFPDYTWKYPWETATALPSKLTATQIKGRELDKEAEEDAGRDMRPMIFDRPDFARRTGRLTPGEIGTAHHMAMQFLDFRKTSSLKEVDGEIKRMVSMEILTPQQGEAVRREAILAFFRSDLGKEVLAAGDGLHREFKFSVLRPAEEYYRELPPGETVLLQGVVDCWFDTPEGLVVVDFKSDRVTEATAPERAEAYRPQLETYGKALSALVNRPVFRRVLWFFSINRVFEV